MAQTKPKAATSPAVVEPKYDLPDKLEHAANQLLGSHIADVCFESAAFIRELITERTSLRVRNAQLESTIKAIAAKAGSI
jgi:hypothetical protein